MTVLNLEHTTCGRRFHPECLERWLPDGTTCPLCRVQIVIRDPCEISEDDRVDFVRQAREQRSPPTEYHVMTNMDEIVRIAWGQCPSILRRDVVENVKAEIKLADEMVDVLGPCVEAGVLAIREILRSPHRYRLKHVSMNNLWILSRLLGVTHVFLAQIKDAHSLGFWVPVLPYYDVKPAMTQANHMTKFYCAALRSSIEQIPLSTAFIQDRIGLDPSFRHETVNLSDIMSEMEKVATDGEMTHWCAFDYASRNGGLPDLCLVPWPRESVIDGFRTPMYPGYSRKCRPSNVNGWSTNSDTDMLASVVEEQRWMAVASLEARFFGAASSVGYVPQAAGQSTGATSEAVSRAEDMPIMQELTDQDEAMENADDIIADGGENAAGHDEHDTLVTRELIDDAPGYGNQSGEMQVLGEEEFDEDVYVTGDEGLLKQEDEEEEEEEEEEDPIWSVVNRIYQQPHRVVDTNY